jgi:hypothetical protein
MKAWNIDSNSFLCFDFVVFLIGQKLWGKAQESPILRVDAEEFPIKGKLPISWETSPVEFLQ